MTPKEKSKELVEKFECYVDYQGDDCFNEREKMLINAKRCALIAVDEIISYCCADDVLFLHKVKEEILKL